jgi:hypothetical protein
MTIKMIKWRIFTCRWCVSDVTFMLIIQAHEQSTFTKKMNEQTTRIQETIALQEQITMAIQKFVNFVVVVDPHPPLLLLDTLLDREEVATTKIANDDEDAVPRCVPYQWQRPDDLFGTGHTKLMIHKSLFLENIRELLEMGLVTSDLSSCTYERRTTLCCIFRSSNQSIMPSGSTVVAGSLLPETPPLVLLVLWLGYLFEGGYGIGMLGFSAVKNVEPSSE